MAHLVGPFGVISESDSSGHFVFQDGVYLVVVEADTNVFFENRMDAIAQGEKPQTAASLGGVLIE